MYFFIFYILDKNFYKRVNFKEIIRFWLYFKNLIIIQKVNLQQPAGLNL